MKKKEITNALEAWKQHCKEIQLLTELSLNKETQQEREERIERARNDYAFFVKYYFPHYCTNPDTEQIIEPAPFHIDTANEIKNNKNIRAVYQWARGHAKSTTIDIMIPMWLKAQKKRDINVVVLVGKSQDSAIGLLSDIQAELQYNQKYINDFGEQVKEGDWSSGEFTTADGCSFHALGRGQSPRGLRDREHRPDYIIIDDLDDDALCENQSRVNKITQWVKEALFGCFGAAGGRFIMVGNLISRTSVLANIADIEIVKVSRVNAINDDGLPSWSANWTLERIKENEIFMGYRAFQKEYMNNPITEGAVFKNDWIKWTKPLPYDQYQKIVLYIDPSFKGTSKNDYKAAKLWAQTKQGELHHLRAFVRQTTVVEMVRWLYDLYIDMLNQGASVEYYMEANFMQDIIIDEFQREGEKRGYQLPIVADKRKKPDKFQRVEAVSPLWERGLVYYNEFMKNDPDMKAGLDQTLAFEKGMRGHDDAPDADEGAIYILQKSQRSHLFAANVSRATSRIKW